MKELIKRGGATLLIVMTLLLTGCQNKNTEVVCKIGDARESIEYVVNTMAPTQMYADCYYVSSDKTVEIHLQFPNYDSEGEDKAVIDYYLRKDGYYEIFDIVGKSIRNELKENRFNYIKIKLIVEDYEGREIYSKNY